MNRPGVPSLARKFIKNHQPIFTVGNITLQDFQNENILKNRFGNFIPIEDARRMLKELENERILEHMKKANNQPKLPGKILPGILLSAAGFSL
jgi:hypothetical protein